METRSKNQVFNDVSMKKCLCAKSFRDITFSIWISQQKIESNKKKNELNLLNKTEYRPNILMKI